jgi:hypothetical protein
MEHPLTRAEAETIIMRVAHLPLGISFRTHCLKRMKTRQLDALDIMRILRNAVVVCDAYKRAGEWRYRVRERPGNAPPWRQDIEVVVIIASEDQVQGHTVYRRRKG